MKHTFLIALLSSVLITAPAAAQCYSKAEAEAEQGLRIHSELMVVGLNCMGILKQPQLYGDYQRFTAQNSAVIAGWERTMMGYFSRNGGSEGKGNPEMALHDFRTRMANQVSTNAARMRPDVFCHNTVPRLNRAKRMDRATLLQWASAPNNALVSKPLCASTR